MTLAPTLWRTCRVLANRKRLRLLHYLMQSPPVSVSVVAEALKWQVNTTSQYLRALNARGLLCAKRMGRYVIYEAAPDASVPETTLLLNTLKSVLLRKDGERDVFETLTSVTHPRRIELLKALHQGVFEVGTLKQKTGISIPAMKRHLRKLKQRGFVIRKGNLYRCAKPSAPLKKALLALVLQ